MSEDTSMTAEQLQQEAYRLGFDNGMNYAQEKAKWEELNWINVDVRMPKPNQLVLCYAICTKGDNAGRKAIFCGKVNSMGIWCLPVASGTMYSYKALTDFEVTHWQPIPAAPTIRR